jgi:hypothetical protein
MHSDDELNAPARMKAVRASGLLDSPADPEFDQLTRLASRLLRAPNAFVTIITNDRQFVKSSTVEDQEATNKTGSSQTLELSFCKFAVASREPLVVEDARSHPLVQESEAVAAGVIAYAGVPLEVQGEAIGALCVVDSRPRSWSQDELNTLRALARSTMRLVEERIGQRGLDAQPGNDHKQGLLKTASEHLRSLEAYDALLTSISVDLTAEKDARQVIEQSFMSLVEAFQERSFTSDAELEDSVSTYIEISRRRTEATKRFADGEVPLPELEALIFAQDDATAKLRLAVFDREAAG